MKNEFDIRLQYLVDELLRLKTARRYSSTRSAQFFTTSDVYTGLYRLTYAESLSEIVAFGFLGNIGKNEASTPDFRVPHDNTQIIEVHTSYYEGGSFVTSSLPLTIISNRAVVNIERIS